MPATTFTAIAEVSFGMLNVFLPGEAIGTADANRARLICNRMLAGWSQRDQYIVVVSRNRFTLTANKGGPTNPYTIGIGGDFNVARPQNQNSITAANLILTATSPEVRVPLGVYTDQAYDANKIPTMSNTQPTGLYYNPYYASDLGKIYLWPVPSTAQNDIELFLTDAMAPFADLTTTYYLPEGGEDVISYQLALRMQGPWGKKLDPADVQIANEVLGVFKRSNAKMSDLQNDAYVFNVGRSIFNIQTGQ